MTGAEFLASEFVKGEMLSEYLEGGAASRPDGGRGRRDTRPRRPRGAPAGLPPRGPHRRPGPACTVASPPVRGPRPGPSLRGEWSRADPQDHRIRHGRRPRAAGRDSDSPVAADVFGLGSILFELLTGQPPQDAESIDRGAASPSARNPKVPKDLEAICLACLEPDPARRLADAGLLADALRQFLDTFVTQFQCSQCSKAIKSRKPLRLGTTVVRCPRCGAQTLVEPLGGKAASPSAPERTERHEPAPAPPAPGRRHDPAPSRTPEPGRHLPIPACRSSDRPRRSGPIEGGTARSRWPRGLRAVRPPRCRRRHPARPPPAPRPRGCRSSLATSS